MAVELDHVIVSAKDQRASAKYLAELLGVPWGESKAGPFTEVYVNGGLTLDFITEDAKFPVEHFAFRVSDADFDAILGRIKKAGIPYRSAVHAPTDYAVGAHGGGRLVYWNEPDGHQWEILTVSYARKS